MKLLAFALLLVTAFTAQAATLHTCVVTAQAKSFSGPGSTRTQTVYLANSAGNRVSASEHTTLLLSLPTVGVQADVWVNDQLQFIFKGNVAKGYFESAWDTGTIKCDAGKDVAVFYQANGYTSPAQAGTILGSCFVGDAEQVAKDLVSTIGFKPSSIAVSDREVTASRVEQQCLKGHGTNPDDWVCEQSGQVTARYAIKNCNADVDPR